MINMYIRRNHKYYFILLMAVTLLIRLPFLTTLNLGVAPIENFNIARHLAQDGHFYSSIKSNFFYDTPIKHSAMGETNIPFPLLVSFLIRIGIGYHGIQILNTLFATIIVLLSFLLFSRFFGLVVGFWSALLISFNQYFLRMSIIAAEDIFFILIVSSILYLFLHRKENTFTVITLGICSGLAYMTRNVGIFLLFSFLIYYTFFSKESKKSIFLLTTFLITIAPILLLISKENGSFIDWIAMDCIRRYDDDRWLWQGFNVQIPSFYQFLKLNIISIAKKNLELSYHYIKGLLDFKYLSFFSIFLLTIKKRHFKNKKMIVLLIYAILNVFVFLTFINGSNESRLLLPSFIFLLPFALFALKNLRIPFIKSYNPKMSFFSAATFLVFFVYIVKISISWVELDEENYFQAPTYESVCDWAKKHTSKNLSYAATVPWVFNLLADRPTIILPYLQSKSEFIDFVKKYDVAYLIVDTGFKPYGSHPYYGKLFMNEVYPKINQESPDLLKMVFKNSYFQNNKLSELLILKVNHDHENYFTKCN